jgi:branched-chain amino acid transport system permease protein
MMAAGLSSLSIFLRVPVVGLPVGAFVGPVILLYGLAAAVIARMESFGTALVAGVALGVIEQTLYYFSRDPAVSGALILPILLAVMLLQRDKLSRGQDSGVSTWTLAKEFRPIPPELRNVPTVVWARVALGAAALAVLLFGYNGLAFKQQILASVVVTYAIVAVSLVILIGWAGQISLGQWGIAGVGAMIAGNLAARHNADFFVTLVLAGVVGAVVAVVIGLPALRITGLYLAVTTLAFGITVQNYLLSPVYFRGFLPQHGAGVPRPMLYGRFDLKDDRTFYYVSLVILALCLASARALRRSRTGRVIIAVRDNPKGAQSYSVNASSAKLWAFAISGFWAAVAGALFSYQQGSVNSLAFSPELSLTLLIVVVIGGITSIPGALLGTLYIGALKYGDISPSGELLATGFGALLLLMFFPGGLAQIFYGTRDSALRWVAARRGIVVPSLLADVMTSDVAAEAEVLTDAAVTAEAHTIDGALQCPVCGASLTMAEAAEHEHFQPVTA